MEEIGITTIKRSEPTLEDAAAEKAAIHHQMQQEEDTYLRFKKLQQHLEFLNTMEEYVVRILILIPSAAECNTDVCA